MSDNKKIKYAVSSCLFGKDCRWNGKVIKNKEAKKIFKKGEAIEICPEMLAGMPVPRPACEIVGGDGGDVINGTAKVLDKQGNDYTEEFITGAKKAVDIIIKAKIEKVYLKSGSPSCAAGHINDGRFLGVRKKGDGIFTSLLKQQGISVEELG